MVQLNEASLKPHLNEYMKMDFKRTMRTALLFMITHGVSISRFKAIFGKMMAANDRLYQMKTYDLEKIDGIFTKKELELLVEFNRYVIGKTSKSELKKYKVPAGVKIETVNAGGVPAEWQIVPGAAEDKVLLYYHGGGFSLYSPATHRPLTIDIALKAKVKVLSVDYRLLPEHGIRDCIEDCFNAYSWLLSRGYKSENIIIGGDSAGGTLTLMVLLKARKEKISLPGGAVCISPSASFDFTEEQMLRNFTTDPGLGTSGTLIFLYNLFWHTDKGVAEFFKNGKIPEDLSDLIPLNASLKGLPPLLFQVSACEMLHYHSKRMVEKAKEDGVQAEIQAWDGMIHVFQLAGINYFPEAKEATTKIASFINERLKKH